MPPMTSRRRVLDTLIEVDPQFVELAKSLYGDVDADLIYQDVYGGGVLLAKADRDLEELASGAYRSLVQITPKRFRPPGHHFRTDATEIGALLHKPVEHKKLTGAFIGTAALANAKGKRKGRRQVFEAEYGKNDRRQRQITAALSATGAAAGLGGLAYAAHDLAHKVKLKEKIPFKTKALIPLEVAGLGGEVMATHILHNDTKRKGKLQPVVKSDIPDLELAGTFSKFDDAKRQAFGYASVVKKNGLPVVDRQGDYIDPDEMEKAAYAYVQKSRKGGDMHRRTIGPNGEDAPHHVSDLIESMVFTPEKCKAMGLPDEVAKQLEGHWWVGYQIHDEDTWEQVRKQGRTGFSIHGRGKRVETSLDELVAGYS